MDRSKLHLKMPKQTMRRKLFLYTFAMAILLLALLATMLILLGRFRTPKDELFEKSDMQAQVFEREILTHRNTLAMMGVHLSEDASQIIGHYLSEHNMTFAELDGNSGALLELQKLIFNPLRQYLFQTDCSGAFVILDVSVNPYSAEVTKSGLYLQVNGYELDRVSRRDEGLIMMLRLLGDEQAALALTEKLHPFSDVRPWASAYVSYAYKNGLTNGTSSYEYSSMMLIEPEQYMTFLLRALGYTDSGDNPDFHYKNAISAAVSFGIISQNEAQMLTSTPLYRDKLAYISYYGLFAHMKGTSTRLLDYLIEKGAVDYNTAQLAILSVTRTRP